MAETFYSVLGVTPDADTETIKAAYREKVKTHHPDVSDAANAREEFKRITDARDVLVDETSRDQYDRVGHDTYVRRYLDSNAWSVDGGEQSRNDSARSRQSSAGSSSWQDSESRRWSDRGSTGGRPGEENAEDYDRYRASYTTGETNHEGNPFDERERRQRAWTEDEEFDWSTAEADGFGDEADASRTAGRTEGSKSRDRRRGEDPWETARAASNVYSTGTRSDGAVEDSDVVDILREIGPWLAFHFVFLVSAFITIWLFMTWTASRSSLTVPALFVSMLLLGFSVFFSILHMISRLYS